MASRSKDNNGNPIFGGLQDLGGSNGFSAEDMSKEELAQWLQQNGGSGR